MCEDRHMFRADKPAFFWALGLLVLSLLVYRSILPAPATLSPYPADTFSRLGQSSFNPVNLSFGDRSMVMASLAANGDRILRNPLQPLGEGQCFPTPDAFTLGEPMLTTSYMAVPFYAATGEPILSYNILLILRLWLAGLMMFFLCRRLGLGDPASFLAGAAFALQAPRLADTDHPYVFGDLWFPLILLGTIRLMAKGGVVNFVLLLSAALLLLGESIYPILGSCLLLAAYGPFLIWEYRTRMHRWILPLGAALGLTLAAAFLLLNPWLIAAETWGTVGSRFSYPAGLDKLLPGGLVFCGPIVLGLAFLGTMSPSRDSFRPDLRKASIFAFLLILWSSLYRTQIPGTEIYIPSLLSIVRAVVPGADSVRALAAVANQAGFPAALLAGYGAHVLLSRVNVRQAGVLTLLLALLILGVRSYGPVTRPLFGHLLRIDAISMRPAEEDLQIYGNDLDGPILEVPTYFKSGQLQRLDPGRFLLMGAWNPKVTSTCYNSFATPLQQQIADIAETLSDPRSAQALASLGFRTLVVHESADRAIQMPSDAELAEAGFDFISEGKTVRVFRMPAAPATIQDPRNLELTKVSLQPGKPAGQNILNTRFRNSSDHSWLHPQPFRPTGVVAHWTSLESDEDFQAEAVGMLPVALGPGQSSEVQWETELPDEGSWQLELSLRDGQFLGTGRLDFQNR